MRSLLCLVLVCGALLATESFGFIQSDNFRYGGFLESHGGKFLSGLLAGKSNFDTGEIALVIGVPSSQQEGMFALQYRLYYENKDGEQEAEALTVATWLLDPESTEVFAIDGEGEKGEVIGKRASLRSEDNLFGAPITIETADTKLKIERQLYRDGEPYLAVSAEKTLADGQVIKWQDKLMDLLSRNKL